MSDETAYESLRMRAYKGAMAFIIWLALAFHLFRFAYIIRVDHPVLSTLIVAMFAGLVAGRAWWVFAVKTPESP